MRCDYCCRFRAPESDGGSGPDESVAGAAVSVFAALTGLWDRQILRLGCGVVWFRRCGLRHSTGGLTASWGGGS